MKRKVMIIIFIIYLMSLFKITVFRPDFGLYPVFEHGKLNFLPFVQLIHILVEHELWQFIYLFIGNIIWFVPFGFLLPFIVRRKQGVILLYGLGLSLFIEFLQYMFGTGVSELDDLILNTLGAWIGFLAEKSVRKLCLTLSHTSL